MSKSKKSAKKPAAAAAPTAKLTPEATGPATKKIVRAISRAFACHEPETFARRILAEALKVMAVYVGSNFCFGKDRAGRIDTLVRLGKELGFLVHPLRPWRGIL